MNTRHKGYCVILYPLLTYIKLLLKVSLSILARHRSRVSPVLLFDPCRLLRSREKGKHFPQNCFIRPDREPDEPTISGDEYRLQSEWYEEKLLPRHPTAGLSTFNQIAKQKKRNQLETV